MITADYVKSLLDYDHEAGVFKWKVSRRKKLNGFKAGKLSNKGYIQICIDGKSYSAHRLAWLVYYGEWPCMDIDHINGDKSDNRIHNLREATIQQNQFNTGMQSNNTSGFKGVTWNKNQGKWNSAITISGKRIHLGSFECAELAHQAYLDAARSKHGEFFTSRASLAQGSASE